MCWLVSHPISIALNQSYIDYTNPYWHGICVYTALIKIFNFLYHRRAPNPLLSSEPEPAPVLGSVFKCPLSLAQRRLLHLTLVAIGDAVRCVGLLNMICLYFI